MRSFRHAGTLMAFAAILLVFLAIGDSIIIIQQRTMLMSDARDHYEREMDLMAAASYEAILKQDYVNIRYFVDRWGAAHEEYRQIRAIAPNGFVIAEFKRPVSPDIPIYDLRKSIKDGARELMTIEMTGGYGETEKIVGMLKIRLVAGSFLLTALLGWALWYAVKKQALLPLEAEVMLRKQSEEYLEAKVEERTRELQKELVERKRIEGELVEREERIRLLLNSTAEAIYGVDLNGVCTFCNPSSLKILGYEKQEDLIGKNMHELIHHTRIDGSPYREDQCRIYSAYRNKQGCHVDDEVFWRADGSSIPVEYWSYPIIRGEEVIGAVATFIDISERKRLEAQLLQSQKMEAIGRLAGGVAHDFNNILTAIVGYGSILRKKITDEALRGNVVAILDASQRAIQLIKSLLAFGRKQIIMSKPFELNAVIRNVEKLLLRLIGADITLTSVLVDGELNVMGDSSQIEQVIMNLATNARDAMPSGGNLSIRSGRLQLDAEQIAAYPSGNPGAYALITISDTGTGIDEKTREKIFEPFFTTKQVGKGTGLGLSIVYAIVKQHSGFLQVYSEPEKGSVFKIYLPLIEIKPLKEEVPEEIKNYPRGAETILVAEDDPVIRELATSLLQEAGYRVIVAEDGDDAIGKFLTNREKIDLAILDVIMPKTNGRKVYEEMKKTRPDMKVIFASGYTGDILSVKAIIEEGFEFIQKPMSPGDLLQKVRNVLDNHK